MANWYDGRQFRTDDHRVPSRAQMRLTFSVAEERHAPIIAGVRAAAARELTARFGDGHWSGIPAVRGVLASMRHSHVLMACSGPAIVGTCRLSRRKPGAIDPVHFELSARPMYLSDMAVRPDYQDGGVGRALLMEAERTARSLAADAIRLDAYDADAGAGEFYAKCGFTFVGRVLYRGVPLLYYERVLLEA